MCQCTNGRTADQERDVIVLSQLENYIILTGNININRQETLI